MPAYDLIVIGSGAAGATAAVTAVNRGASRVAIVERGVLWGTCVNNGCIPSKFLLTRAEHFFKDRGPAGSVCDHRFDLDRVLSEKDALIARLKQKKTDRIETGLKVEIIRGNAEFLSSTELHVGGRIYTAKRFIIATGSSPSVPPLPGIGRVPYMTSVDALNPASIPDSLIVIGGRSLGLEFAQLYAHLGTKVTLLQRSPRIIPEEEPEIAALLSGYLREEGIDIRTAVEIRKLEKTPAGIEVTAAVEGSPWIFSAEQLLLATGRSPETGGLQPGMAGVKTGPGGAVLVDAFQKTSAQNIWAAGDVTGEPMLETAARYSGEIAAGNAFLGTARAFDRHLIPRGIFTMPQVASIGMTEEQARAAGLDPETRSLPLNFLAKASIMGDTRGLVKIIAGKPDNRVLGVHICAPLATEILAASVLAVKHEMQVHELADMYNLFPTTSEAVSLCARRFGKNC